MLGDGQAMTNEEILFYLVLGIYRYRHREIRRECLMPLVVRSLLYCDSLVSTWYVIKE